MAAMRNFSYTFSRRLPLKIGTSDFGTTIGYVKKQSLQLLSQLPIG